MKKVIIFILIVVLVLILTPSLIHAKPGWGQIQEEWEFTTNYLGVDYVHHMSIDYLDPSTGDFSGVGYYKVTPGITWDVTGNISNSDVYFNILYTGIDAGYWIDVNGIIADDGSFMSGNWENANQNGTWEWAATEGVVSTDTKAAILMKIGIPGGVPGIGLVNAPGLQKPFNPNSRAAERAGKKNKNSSSGITAEETDLEEEDGDEEEDDEEGNGKGKGKNKSNNGKKNK